MNIFLFIGLIFIATLFLGRIFEKIRVPWIFSALLIGSILAVNNSFANITDGDTFTTFAQLGMYFLLFLVGFEIDTGQLKKNSLFIFRSTVFIILLEGLLGAILVHFLFAYSWLISMLVALSFATVGEAVLIPILQEFKIINTTLGQSIIGIGTADDIVEIFLLLLVSLLVGTQSAHEHIVVVMGSLLALAVLSISLTLFKKERQRFRFASIETLFLFILFVFFIFIGIAAYAEAAPLAAIIAGIVVRLFVPANRLKFIENEFRSLTYGFFAPLFFVWIGSDLDISYLFSYPLLVLLVILISGLAKILGSWVTGRKKLSNRGSILLGVGLSVRFSTSIIIIKFLYDNHVIDYDIYSVVVASSIAFMFIIPFIFSRLVVIWKKRINPVNKL